MSNFTSIKVTVSQIFAHNTVCTFFGGSWCSYLHVSCLSSLLWHCSGAHRPLVLQEVWISGESSSRGESRDHSSFTTSEKYLRLNRFAVQTDHRDEARAAAGANLRRKPTALLCVLLQFVVMSNDMGKNLIDAGWKKILLIGSTTCVFTYLKGFSQNLLPSFGLCLFATFTSVYYAAPAIVPHQMDLIQIVKMSD